MEDIISQEAEEFCDNLKARMVDGQCCVKGNGIYAPAANNVIWRIATGSRKKQTDPSMVTLTEQIKELFMVLDPGTLMSILTAYREVLYP